MKKLTLLFVFALLYISIYSQDKYKNFILENNRVFFQKVYEVPGKSASEINKLFYNLINSNKCLSYDRDITNFNLSNFKIDYKKYGYSYMDITLYISQSLFNANGKVDFKDGKYRVTLFDISYTSENEFTLGGVTTKLEHEPIEGTIVKNNKALFRKSQQDNIALMSNNFNDLFDYKNITEVIGGDNW